MDSYSASSADSDDRFPSLSKELIEELNKRFPELSPQSNEGHELLRWRGGQRAVVAFLNRKFDEQMKQALVGQGAFHVRP